MINQQNLQPFPPGYVREHVDLDILAIQINHSHEETERLAGESLENGRRTGELLLKAKQEAGHGNWLNWLRKNVRFSQSMASKYMRVASRWTEIQPKLELSSNLTEALRVLAAADEPEPEEVPQPPAPQPDLTEPQGDLDEGTPVSPAPQTVPFSPPRSNRDPVPAEETPIEADGLPPKRFNGTFLYKAWFDLNGGDAWRRYDAKPYSQSPPSAQQTTAQPLVEEPGFSRNTQPPPKRNQVTGEIETPNRPDGSISPKDFLAGKAGQQPGNPGQGTGNSNVTPERDTPPITTEEQRPMNCNGNAQTQPSTQVESYPAPEDQFHLQIDLRVPRAWLDGLRREKDSGKLSPQLAGLIDYVIQYSVPV